MGDLKFFIVFNLVFSFWMIFDAFRRRAEFYWYLIILFVPFGPIIYFFVVKIRDYRLPMLGGLAAQNGGSLSELQRKVLESPSVGNQLDLADALYKRQAYEDAARLYEGVLSRDADEKAALHGLGCTRMAQGDAASAVKHLWRLAELDNAYRDHSAILDLAEALWACDRVDETLELLEGLVGESGRMNHRLALAHYQNEAGHTDDARATLDDALKDFEQQPPHAQQRGKKWAMRAADMRRKLN